MFQTFDTASSPEYGPARLAALRRALAGAGLAGFIVPRADVHQGEYVAACDARLEWLTGFTGSAGFCVVLPEVAGVFIDGRYRAQVMDQVDLAAFTPVPWPEEKAGPWVVRHLATGKIGFDPWLHTRDEIAAIEAHLAGSAVTLHPCGNLIDGLWQDRPPAPMGQVFVHDLAGQSSADKRAQLGETLRESGARAAILTLPDSICWLLNIRGADVPRNPVLHAFAIVHDTGHVDLFAQSAKFDKAVLAHLGPDVRLHPPKDFESAVAGLVGPVQLDGATAPLALAQILQGTDIMWGDDPARLPKARKNAAEIAGMRAAHLRDGAAMVEFLAWAAGAAQNPKVTEIDIVGALEGFRAATNMLHDISFDTICGAGSNGAIIHYRVTKDTNRALGANTLLLVDSGAQYPDGTTDITRVIAVGDPSDFARDCYTRVLQGLIAISRARWPTGLAGRDLDALARAPLWMAGRDYDHGTGHGVGAFLSVHEGPQRLSRQSDVPLEAGMILSNEPGYYRAGEFGIRLENLIVVQSAPDLPGGDSTRGQLCFETLTLAPFERGLVNTGALSQGERDWLNAYHAWVLDSLASLLSPPALAWCKAACAPITPPPFP
jgi:Xaa-Pro aminopeptidase